MIKKIIGFFNALSILPHVINEVEEQKEFEKRYKIMKESENDTWI